MIDLHVHALAGIDDGPPDLAAAVALAKAAHDDGTRTLVATPHVSDRYPNTPESITTAAATLRERLAAEGVAISLLTGAEIAIERLALLDDAALDAVALGEGPYLLIESPLSVSAGDVEAPLTRLLGDGRPLLLAHPERSPAFHREPELLGRLVGLGVLTSVTAGAFTGAFGKTVQRFADRMLQEGLLHNVASDAHDVGSRSPALSEGLGRVESMAEGPWKEWLARTVPEAVLRGEPIPAAPPPPSSAPRGIRRLLGRR